MPEISTLILQSIPLVIAIDPNAQITFSQNPDNPRFGSQVHGQYLDQLYPDELFTPNLKLALNGKEITTELQIDEIWFEAKFCPLYAEGSVVGALCLGIKITEPPATQTRYAVEDNFYRAIFNQSPVGMGIAEQDGHLIDFNAAMLKPGGYSASDIAQVGNNVTALYCNPDDRQKVVSLLREKGFVDRFPIDFKRKDGSCYPTLLTLRPFRDDNFTGVLATVEDLGPQQEAQKSLQTSSDELLRLNQTLIGREIKMVELKNRIKELEAKLAT